MNERRIRSVVELIGLACLVAAAWTIAIWTGLVALGIALLLAAYFAGRSPLSE